MPNFKETEPANSEPISDPKFLKHFKSYIETRRQELEAMDPTDLRYELADHLRQLAALKFLDEAEIDNLPKLEELVAQLDHFFNRSDSQLLLITHNRALEASVAMRRAMLVPEIPDFSASLTDPDYLKSAADRIYDGFTSLYEQSKITLADWMSLFNPQYLDRSKNFTSSYLRNPFTNSMLPKTQPLSQTDNQVIDKN